MNDAKNKIQCLSYLEKRLLSILVVFVFSHNLVLSSNHKVQVVEVIVADSNVVNEEELIKSSIVSISDNTDTLNENISQIRQHVESISNNTETYLEEAQKESKLNRIEFEKERRLTKIGLILSFFSIVAVVVIYILTQLKTKKQILDQHADTLKQINSQERAIAKQIKEQHKDTARLLDQQSMLSAKQIQKMQEQKESIERLEKRALYERDKSKIEDSCSSAISNYKALCDDLEKEYDHFNNNLNSIIYQKASSIKDSIRIISQTLSCYSTNEGIPDATSYINAINEVVNKPSFQNKREQINSFKNEGKRYYDKLDDYIQTYFYNKYL